MPSKNRKQAMTEEQKARRRAADREYYHKNREKRRAGNRRWEQENKERHLAAKNRWKKNNPARIANYHLKKKYNITLADRDRMIMEQSFECSGCGTSFWDVLPCVDHCHSTGKIRGILCDPCNIILGKASDKASTLRRLAQYLDDSQAPVRNEREWTEQ